MQTEIAVTDKKDTEVTLATNLPLVTGNNKSIMMPQKVSPVNSTTTKEQFEMTYLSRSWKLQASSWYKCL